MALGMGLCVWFLRFRPFEKQPKCQHKDQGFSNRCRIGYPATELSTNGQHARVILANDHTAIAEKWTMNKSTYICPIEKSGIFQPSNLQGSSWEDSTPCKNLQLPGQHPVSCKQIFGVASRYGNCTCPVPLNVGLPGITHSSLKWGSPGEKGFSPTLTAKAAAKKNRDRLEERCVSLGFSSGKCWFTNLKSIEVRFWEVIFLMKLLSWAKAKITQILTVTKMACVAVQHPSSINHHHPMILLDGLGLEVAWNPHVNVSVDSDLIWILFCLIVLVL